MHTPPAPSLSAAAEARPTPPPEPALATNADDSAASAVDPLPPAFQPATTGPHQQNQPSTTGPHQQS